MCATNLSYTTGREYRREIKLIFNELDITIHVIALQLSGHCDDISNVWIRYVVEKK